MTKQPWELDLLAESGRLLASVFELLDRTPLLGAEGYEVMWNQRRQIAERTGLHVARIEHLLRRFGSPLCPTIPARDLTQLAGLAHQWLRDVASSTGSRLLSRSRFVLKHVRTGPRGDAA